MPRDFDDFDDDLIDDTFPTPAPVQARLGDSEVLLRRAVDIIVGRRLSKDSADSGKRCLMI